MDFPKKPQKLKVYKYRKTGFLRQKFRVCDKWSLFCPKLSFFRLNWKNGHFNIFQKWTKSFLILRKRRKKWKFINRSKNLTENVKIWTHFSVFGFKFFFQYFSFSAFKNWDVTSKTLLLEHAVLWPLLREHRVSQIELNFLYVATHFSPKIQGLIFSIRHQSDSFYQ